MLQGKEPRRIDNNSTCRDKIFLENWRTLSISQRRREAQSGFKPCRQSKCPVCDHLSDKNKVIKSVIASSTGEEIKVKGELTCSTTSVVYCITCRRGGRICPTNPQYIGETNKEIPT